MLANTCSAPLCASPTAHCLQVVLARSESGELVAIKYAAARKEAVLAQEACMHARLAHENVVRLRAIVLPAGGDTTTGGGLVMDYCAGGTLAEWLGWNRARGGPPLSMLRRLDVVDQVLAALEHMHERGVCHLDVKPCNVMLSSADLLRPQRVYLTDLGLSQCCNGVHMAGRYRGTLPYMAPELARNLRSLAEPALDVWSVGVIMRELVSQVPPCASWEAADIKAALRVGSLYGETLPCEPEWAQLMGLCLQYDPAARASVAEVRSVVRALCALEGHRAAARQWVEPPEVRLAPRPAARRPDLCLPESLELGVAVACGVPAQCAGAETPGVGSLRLHAGARQLNLPESLGLTSF
jgi:serine/threonine protein kinase